MNILHQWIDVLDKLLEKLIETYAIAVSSFTVVFFKNNITLKLSVG